MTSATCSRRACRDLRARRPLGAVDGMPADGCPQAAAAVDRRLHDERLLAAAARARVVGLVAGELDRLPDALVRRADAQPRRAGAGPRAAGPRRACPRGAARHARRPAPRDGLGAPDARAASRARASLLADALVANEPQHPLSVAAERRTAVRRRLQSDLERYLAHAAAAESPLEPAQLELGIRLRGGRRARRGERPAGARSRGRPTAEGADRPRRHGRRWRRGRVRLQGQQRARGRALDQGRQPAGGAVHARGRAAARLRTIGGFYQPLSGQDLRARGVLDGEAGVELDRVATDVLDHADMRELLERSGGGRARGRSRGRPGRAGGTPGDVRVSRRLYVPHDLPL